MGEMDNKEGKFNRSDFMKATIAGIGGLIGVAYGLPAIAYVIGPALIQGSSDWIQLGSVNKVEMNTPTLFKTVVETQTGWIKSEEEISAYVLTENGQDYVVMSNVCTHLGCRIRWIAEQGQFFCPCHNGSFAKDGTVTGGPPPRPLDRFESKVENGTLFIKRGG
jgi:menaquinol-cytochrome c reductase iron-sulfur subunit